MCTAGDRKPRLRTNRVRARIEIVALAVHAAHFDPLVGRLPACERDEIQLRVEHVAEAVEATPVLQRVEIEPEHVRAGGQRGIHAPALRQRCRVAVEVVRQRQEARPRARAHRHQPERIVDGEVVRQMRVPFVGQMRADCADPAVGRLLCVGDDECRAVQPACKLRAAAARIAHERVDADGEVPGRGIRALVEHHLREGGLTVEQDRAVPGRCVYRAVEVGRREQELRDRAASVRGRRCHVEVVRAGVRQPADGHLVRPSGRRRRSPDDRCVEPVRHARGRRLAGLQRERRREGSQRDGLDIRDRRRRTSRHRRSRSRRSSGLCRRGRGRRFSPTGEGEEGQVARVRRVHARGGRCVAGQLARATASRGTTCVRYRDRRP